jgi:CheY-like chemotaxis protein
MTAPIETLMLIDDNEADTFLCRLMIEEAGLADKLLVFNLAEDALTYMRKNPGPIDAILLDIRMPRMSGFEFIEAALAEFGSTFAKAVIVMLTTSLDVNDKMKADQFGVIKGYFEKPLSQTQLETIAAMVSGSH